MLSKIYGLILLAFITAFSCNSKVKQSTMKEDVIVSIEEKNTEESTSTITIKIVNNQNFPIWLVNDSWFVWDRKKSQITLSFAREKMVEGVEVFGYFDPNVVKILPVSSFAREVQLTWPLSLSTIWNKELEASPPSGEYTLRVKVGYGLSEKIEDNLDKPKGFMGQHVLEWQKCVYSDPIEIIIPEY